MNGSHDPGFLLDARCRTSSLDSECLHATQPCKGMPPRFIRAEALLTLTQARSTTSRLPAYYVNEEDLTEEAPLNDEPFKARSPG